MVRWGWLLVVGMSAAIVGCGGSSSNQGGGAGEVGTQVTVRFSGTTPAAVATKIGSGAFTAATPAATLSFEVPSGTTDFSVAYVCPAVPVTIGLTTVESSSERVLNANIADGVSYAEVCPTSAAGETTGTLTVADANASALGATYMLLQASNGSSTTSLFLAGASISGAMGAPIGNDRVNVLAYRYPLPSDMQAVPPSLVGAKFFENQAVPGALNGGEPVVLTEADATIPEPLTFSNVPAGYGTPFAQVSCVPAGQKASVMLTSGATTSYPALPLTVAQTGDTYQILGEATMSLGSGSQSTGPGESIVAVQLSTSTPGPTTVSFPAAWSYTGPPAAALPTFSYSYGGFSGSSKMARTGSIAWETASQAQSSIVVTATVGYQGGASTLAVPDLTGMAGFIASPAAGTTVTWIAAIESGTSSSASGSSGTSTQTVESVGTFVVP